MSAIPIIETNRNYELGHLDARCPQSGKSADHRMIRHRSRTWFGPIPLTVTTHFIQCAHCYPIPRFDDRYHGEHRPLGGRRLRRRDIEGWMKLRK